MLQNSYVEDKKMSISEASNTYQVVMPRLGLTMREGKIIEWYKQDGDQVEKGEPLFSIENEKASLDIESPASGTLKIQVPIDTVVPILSPVAVLFGTGFSGSHHGAAETIDPVIQKSQTQVVPKATAEKTMLPTAVCASPKARNAAKRAGIDLAGLTGTGIRGMIVLSDVNQKIQNQPVVKATPLAKLRAAEIGLDLRGVKGTGLRGMVRREDVNRMSAAEPTEQSDGIAKPLSELRSIISNRLSQSWVERPQVTLVTEADATLFVQARQQLNIELGKKNIKLSFNALFIKVAAQTLAEHPFMNVSLIPEGLYQHPQINVGLAVDTERGLMVPVVREANLKSMEIIQNDLDGLVSRTLQGNNKMEEISGGTFTITNLGAYEIDAFTPIINPPECAILGIGRIHQKPIGLDGQIVLRSMVTLSLSFDHRLVDGAPAAKFLQRIKQYVEQPFLWSLWKE
ncbi:MAG: branched-chain alpha-keto acid dehydrogenase subunit E2 [Chloroflexi bacterium HGW-Chloroflexi-10]|nr:MAG: branched-chain alpha-keto acid dehydrogenase subunit E2 [Chloroflexi bacterium HGW-Chloroflexi-10]